MTSTLVLVLVAVGWSVVSEATVIPKRSPGPVVEIPGLGKVVGDINYSYFRNRTFYQFKGIRFGVAPSGERRFQPSEQPGPWNGTIDATHFRRVCPQPKYPPTSGSLGLLWKKMEFNVKQELIGKGEIIPESNEDGEDLEDCLFLYIYTPNLGIESKLPVMVFIHGGAFVGGSALPYGARRFMDKDVVLVIPQYRLGPLGFLSLQTDDIPGNAGMLDQVLALEWIRDHISVFGGDPNLVTIFGESAGAFSVAYLLLSPLAKGLFHRVIGESGSCLASWAIDYTPVYHAVNIAAGAGCNITGADGGKGNLSEVTKCLKTVDTLQIINASVNYHNNEVLNGYNTFGGNSPVVQKAGKMKYITMPPMDIIKSGDYSNVPIMFGANRDEGTFLMAQYYEGYMVPNGLVDNKDYLTYGVPDSFLKMMNIEDPSYWLNDAFINTYMTPETTGNFTAMCYGLIDFLGTMVLKGPQYLLVQLHSQKNNSYFYAFDFLGNSTRWGAIAPPGLPFEGGVCHSNELLFLFDSPSVNLDDEEEEMSKKLIGIWTNFGIYGEPNPDESIIQGVPKWMPYTYEDEFYMRLDRNITAQRDYTKEYTIGMQMHGMINQNKQN